jgi:hypothetical protein
MMRTIEWRAASADPLVFQPVQPDGTLAPLEGLAMQLRVQARNACIRLDGVRAGSGDQAGFDVALSALTLPRGAYVASEYYNAGRGWRHVADHVLVIEGGC